MERLSRDSEATASPRKCPDENILEGPSATLPVVQHFGPVTGLSWDSAFEFC